MADGPACNARDVFACARNSARPTLGGCCMLYNTFVVNDLSDLEARNIDVPFRFTLNGLSRAQVSKMTIEPQADVFLEVFFYSHSKCRAWSSES